MTLTVSVRLEGAEEFRKLTRAFGRAGAKRIMGETLKRSAFEVERLAKTKYLRRGGGAPVADRLTTRSGRLARSIAVNLARLPRFATVGTNVVYAPPHEFGGRVTQQVPQHTRSVVFGRRVAPFSVGPYSRTVTFPKRPFLTPAVQEVGARFFRKELRRQARRSIRRNR